MREIQVARVNNPCLVIVTSHQYLYSRYYELS